MGVAKARESRCDGNLGLFSLWAVWIVGIGWVFTCLGQSSVAVGQPKFLSMNLRVILIGSCQNSCHVTCLFSWCFACWKHSVCAWVCFPCPSSHKHQDAPARCQFTEFQGMEEADALWSPWTSYGVCSLCDGIRCCATAWR